MRTKKTTTLPSKIMTALVVLAAVLLAVFLMGRYGWKLGGFRACQSAGISSVEVHEHQVRLTGFYPGSFPEGFCGYYAKEQSGTLYVGFRFSAVFGIFETGDFDITIPVKGEIHKVMLKTRMNESPIWNAEDGAVPQSERYGVYVKLETHEVCSLSMSYAGESHDAAAESGEYLFLENDIAFVSKDAGTPIPFTLTAAKEDGSVFASGAFSYDYRAAAEKMYLTVTADGRILDDTAGHVPSPAETPTALEAYATVIGEYDTALKEGWDAAQVMEAGLNYMAADRFFPEPLESIGYGVADLDGNGTEELVIGSLAEDEFYGKLVFSLYTLDSSGVPQLLLDSTERSRYYYAGGSKFANLSSSGWNESFATTLELKGRELVDTNCATDPADYVQMDLTPFSQWSSEGGPAA